MRAAHHGGRRRQSQTFPRSDSPTAGATTVTCAHGPEPAEFRTGGPRAAQNDGSGGPNDLGAVAEHAPHNASLAVARRVAEVPVARACSADG